MTPYDKMTVDERIDWHAFEQRRHSEALEHLHTVKRLSDMPIDTTHLVNAASACYNLSYDTFTEFREQISGPLWRVDAERLTQDKVELDKAVQGAVESLPMGQVAEGEA